MVEATECQEEAWLFCRSANNTGLVAEPSSWIYSIFGHHLSYGADLYYEFLCPCVDGGLLLNYDQVI